jgi:hypothetical protein
MNRILCTLFLFITASVCSAAGKKDTIIFEVDSFRGDAEITTAPFVSRKGMFDKFPVTISYRANYQKDELQFMQLYVTISNTEWGFFHQAFGQDGENLELINITEDIETIEAAKMVIVKEDVALTISTDYLSKMAESDWEIKLYGKKREGVFTVPAITSRKFKEAVECFERADCDIGAFK